MNSLLEKNTSILRAHHQLAHEKIINPDGESEIEVVESKEGTPVPVFNRDGRKMVIHSKFNPFKEAERFINEIDVNKFNLFIVLGFCFCLSC